jgi:hypothetical protein
MNSEPKYERMDSTPANAGAKLPPATKKRIESLLKQGTPPAETAKLVAADPDTVREIRNNLADAGQLDMLAFKRRTAARLASFIDKSLQRLDEEVDDIPIGQLMLPTAIAIDKMEKLVDPTPTVQVKAELRISADDINKLLGFGSPTIDVTPPAEENTKG